MGRVQANDTLDHQAKCQAGHEDREVVVLQLALLQGVEGEGPLRVVSPEHENERHYVNSLKKIRYAVHLRYVRLTIARRRRTIETLLRATALSRNFAELF